MQACGGGMVMPYSTRYGGSRGIDGVGRGPRALVIVAQSCWHVEEEWLCLTQPGMGGSRGIGGG